MRLIILGFHVTVKDNIDKKIIRYTQKWLKIAIKASEIGV